MSAEGNRVPDLLLEQYALGELSPAEKARLDSAIESDSSLRSRLDELRSSDEAILREAPPVEIAAAIRRRMLSSSKGRDDGLAGRAKGFGGFRPVAALLFPLAAAFLVFAGAVLAKGHLFPTVEDLTRPKGGAPGISVYKRAATGVEELHDGAFVSAGDVLQVKYAAGSARYGAIFSIDGRGNLTRHLPEGGSEATRLSEAGAALESAYELDDAPGFERFFIVSSSRPFAVAVAADALRDLATSGAGAAMASPKLPDGLEWKSLLLRKHEAAL
jgi:hypothetical protein